MADSEQNIQEGDQVRWSYGEVSTSGVVEGGIQTAAQLEIESTSRQVYKDANTSMLMTREGGDELEGMSELEKIGDAPGAEGDALALAMGVEEKGKGGEKVGGGQEGSTDKTKAGKVAEVGEKRGRSEAGKEGEESVGETGVVEEQREGGKEAKKQKTDVEGGGETMDEEGKGGETTSAATAAKGKSHAKKAGRGRGRQPAKKAAAHGPRGPHSKKAAAFEAAGDTTMEDAATTAKKAEAAIMTPADPPAVHTRSRD